MLRAWRPSVCLLRWSMWSTVQRKVQVGTWQDGSVYWLPAHRSRPGLDHSIPWYKILLRNTSGYEKLKLIDRLRATRWTLPDYWQTDNSNGLVMVIRNCHWLNSASRVLISTCSTPLVQTEECKQFSLFDLWPTTLTYNPRLAKVKVYPHAKNQGKGQTVQTGERPQTNGQTHTHMYATKRTISLAMRSIKMWSLCTLAAYNGLHACRAISASTELLVWSL